MLSAERLQVLAYGQSDYVRAFGLNIDEASLPLEINARVIEPPVITYGAQSKSASVVSRLYIDGVHSNDNTETSRRGMEYVRLYKLFFTSSDIEFYSQD